MNLAFCREIFGPLLPVIPVEDLDEAIKFVNERLDFYYIHTYLIHFTQRPSSGALYLLDSQVKTKGYCFPFPAVS